MPRDDDPGCLTTLARVNRLAQVTLPPRLRARDALLDHFGGKREPVRLRPRMNVAALLSIEIVRSFRRLWRMYGTSGLSFVFIAPPVSGSRRTFRGHGERE